MSAIDMLMEWGDSVVKRTPPIMQPVFIIAMLCILVVVGVIAATLWLIGFYQCKGCWKFKHVFFEGKEKLEDGKVVCEGCEDNYY